MVMTVASLLLDLVSRLATLFSGTLLLMRLALVSGSDTTTV